jgi:hypothetical protein
MSKSRMAVLGAVVFAAVLGAAGTAHAQHSPPAHVRSVIVPPGAMVIVLPAEPVAVPMMPDPVALIQQADQMLADAQRVFASPGWAAPDRMLQAAMRQMQQAGGAVSGVVVTSFSDPHGTCTRRVLYSGNGAAPVMHVSMTGNACSPDAMPAVLPGRPAPKLAPELAPRHALPRTLRVDNSRSPAATVQLAALER